MKREHKDNIINIITDANLAIGRINLQMRFKIGAVIKNALETGAAKTLDGAADEISYYIEKKTGETFGSHFWRKAYWLALKLSEKDQALMIKNNISITDAGIIAGKKLEDVKQVMKTIRAGKFKGYKGGGTNRGTRNQAKEAAMHTEMEKNLTEPIVLDWPFDYEDTKLKLTRYVKRFETTPELIQKLFKEVQQAAGIRLT